MSDRLLPLRLCTVVNTDAEVVRPLVRCPRQDNTILALECMGCSRMRSFEWHPEKGGSITCNAPLESGPVRIDRRADIAEAAARVRLHEMVSPVTTCVTRDLPIARVKELACEKGTRMVAVVTDDGHLLGLLSRTDLTTAAEFGTVADIMPRNVLSLPEDATLASAIALMAFSNVSEVPVVNADGILIGVLHALEAMRWIAERMGYVMSSKDDPADASA